MNHIQSAKAVNPDFRLNFQTENQDRLMSFGRDLELLYVLTGRVMVTLPSRSLTLGPEDLIVINRYQVHSVSYKEHGCSISLRIPAELLARIDLGAVRCCSVLQPEFPEVFDDIRAKLASIYQFYLAGYDAYDLYLLSECYELLGILRQYFREKPRSDEDSTAAAADPEKTKWLADVLEYTGKHHAEDISLNELSDRFHVSEGHLSRTLRQFLGMTPGEYRRQEAGYDTALQNETPGEEAGHDTVPPDEMPDAEASRETAGSRKSGGVKSGAGLSVSKLSRHLREEDFNRFKGYRDKEAPVEAAADMKSGKVWKHDRHSRSIKISHAGLLMIEEVRDALREARKEG